MPDVATDRESTWARLRRRKVVQWGIAYAAGAWGVLQGIGFFADAFHWPEASKQIAALALVIGLPIALVVAWYHGDRGEQRVRRAELALIGAILVAGTVLLWRYEATRVVTHAPATRTTASPTPNDDARPTNAVLPY